MNNSIQESKTTTQNLLDDPVPAFSYSNTSLIKPTNMIKPISVSKPSSVLNSSDSISKTKPVENYSSTISSLYKPNSMDTKQSGLDQVSASLPRSYQRSDSARLTSVVTPRPFGTQATRITSLPRAFTVSWPCLVSNVMMAFFFFNEWRSLRTLCYLPQCAIDLQWSSGVIIAHMNYKESNWVTTLE